MTADSFQLLFRRNVWDLLLLLSHYIIIRYTCYMPGDFENIGVFVVVVGWLLFSVLVLVGVFSSFFF